MNVDDEGETPSSGGASSSSDLAAATQRSAVPYSQYYDEQGGPGRRSPSRGGGRKGYKGSKSKDEQASNTGSKSRIFFYPQGPPRIVFQRNQFVS